MMNNNENIEVKNEHKRREWLGFPIFSWVFFALAAFALVLMLVYNLSEGFANFYNRYPAAFLRGAQDSHCQVSSKDSKQPQNSRHFFLCAIDT